MTLEHKHRQAKNVHRTLYPKWYIFDVVVSRYIIRVALNYASLNDLHIQACNAQNDYLQESILRKTMFFCGPKFGLENAGKHTITFRTLHCGKSARDDHWKHVRSAIEKLEFSSYKADPDV